MTDLFVDRVLMGAINSVKMIPDLDAVIDPRKVSELKALHDLPGVPEEFATSRVHSSDHQLTEVGSGASAREQNSWQQVRPLLLKAANEYVSTFQRLVYKQPLAQASSMA